MSAEQLLAIDHGTQSVRALIFDLRGNLLAKSQVPIQAHFTTHPGWAAQDPQVFWNALCRACQALWSMPGVEKSALVGASLTTQRSTIINLDEHGQPVRQGE